MQEKNVSITSSLFDAISSGDIRTVESLLARGANVNAENEEEKTPLYYATLLSLLARGANVKADFLLFKGKQDVAKQIVILLLDNGANINARGKDGFSPLSLASSAKHTELVEFLLSQGADINAKNMFGYTPLHSTFLSSTFPFEKKDIYTLIRVLLNHGADVNAQNNNKETPLHMAVLANYRETEELLKDVNAQNNNKEMPLHMAVLAHYRETAELLIQSGAHTNIPDRHGRIPVVTNDKLCLEQVAVPDRDSYHTIMRNLNERIKTVEKQINTFKFSKETKKVVYLPKSPMKELSSEEIIFIAQAKAESRGEHNVDRQYLLIDNEPNFNELSSKINRNIQNNIPFDYYIIVKSNNVPFANSIPLLEQPILLPGTHCTPLRIDYNGKDIKFAYIDTMSTSANIASIDGLYNSTDIEKKEKIFYAPKEYILNGTSKLEDYLQRDNVSCSIFAIQDLNTMSKINRDDLSKHITSDLGELSPRFVKNSQSMRSLQKNLQKDDHKSEIVSKGKTLRNYMEEFCIETQNWDYDTMSTKVKIQNMAIYDKTLKYLNAATQTLDRTYTRGGEEAVQEIISQRAGNKIFKFPKYIDISNLNNSKTQNKSPISLSSLLNGRFNSVSPKPTSKEKSPLLPKSKP